MKFNRDDLSKAAKDAAEKAKEKGQKLAQEASARAGDAAKTAADRSKEQGQRLAQDAAERAKEELARQRDRAASKPSRTAEPKKPANDPDLSNRSGCFAPRVSVPSATPKGCAPATSTSGGCLKVQWNACSIGCLGLLLLTVVLPLSCSLLTPALVPVPTPTPTSFPTIAPTTVAPRPASNQTLPSQSPLLGVVPIPTAAPSSEIAPPTNSGAKIGSGEVSPQQATARGLVWVNSETNVYHRPGGRWYGSTDSGYYTTEQQAQADGNRLSLR